MKIGEIQETSVLDTFDDLIFLTITRTLVKHNVRQWARRDLKFLPIVSFFSIRADVIMNAVRAGPFPFHSYRNVAKKLRIINM